MGTCCLSSFLLARANYFWTWSHLHLDAWCLSNFNVSIDHLEILLRCRFQFSSLSESEGWGGVLNVCLSHRMVQMLLVHGLHFSDASSEVSRCKGTCPKSDACLHTEKRLEPKSPGSQTQVSPPPLFISLSLMERRTGESNSNSTIKYDVICKQGHSFKNFTNERDWKEWYLITVFYKLCLFWQFLPQFQPQIWSLRLVTSFLLICPLTNVKRYWCVEILPKEYCWPRGHLAELIPWIID